ncbi:serine hydrolase domain-containing protein [Dyadobacter sp. NIV53]|uniref:serine hydrolase domain-containing protein n=1 Tax=Dyadobacter sp. NIV53 TaxID=2861765 RepID=UPI001C876025
MLTFVPQFYFYTFIEQQFLPDELGRLPQKASTSVTGLTCTKGYVYKATPDIPFFMFCGFTLYAQNKKAKLSEIMQTYHNYNMFDGAVLVAENGKIIYKGAFGLANREWNIPNATDTKFMIGSVSKSLTATLMLIQVQKGLVDLNKTVSDYLPDLKPNLRPMSR